MIDLYFEQFGDIVVIHLNGTFNIDNVTKIETIVMEQFNKGPQLIAINCKGLESMDSSAIGSIVKLFHYAKSHGIMLLFYDLNPLLQKLFVTAKLNRYFNITTKTDFENRYVYPTGAFATRVL
jgi:anti-anti-sigma factor